MATRQKPNWKVLDVLLPMLEHEGWSHAQIAADWGISLTTLEGHLEEVCMPPKPRRDWSTIDPVVDELQAKGWSARKIARELRIPQKTLDSHLHARDPGTPPVHHRTPEHPGTLEGHQEVMADVSESVPDTPHIGTDAEQSAVQSAAELFGEHDVEVHVSVQTPGQPMGSRVGDSAETSVDDSADESQVRSLSPEPVQTAVQKVDTGPVQPFDTGAVQRIDQLEDDVRRLTQMMRSVMDRVNQIPVQTPMQITALPPYPKGKAVRWNIWILDAIQDELKTLAAEQDMSPSQLVQELLWKALNDRSASMP
jgi:lambda repressor-like predicted transcriptional regulator